MQQQHAAALASNALLPPPPPPPPLPHHHNLHHYQQQTRLQQQQQQQNLIHNPIPAVVSPTQFSIRAPPPIPGSFVNQTITINQNVIPSSSNPDDINKTIEKLIEQLNVFNLEKLKKSSESKQQQQIGTSSSTSSTNSIERDVLTSSIRTQTEQNQLLKRLFNELEKELRSLTDTRIALEIKLDFLNTATVNSNVVNNNNNISISGSSVTTTNTNSNVNTNQSIVTSISQQQVNNITQTPTTKQSIQKILPNTPASTVSIATSNSNMTPSYSSTTNSLSSSSNNNNNNNNSSLTTPVTTVNNTLIANPSNKI
jgi:vacuolar-type H+-ATPase subunit I/STV1